MMKYSSIIKLATAVLTLLFEFQLICHQMAILLLRIFQQI